MVAMDLTLKTRIKQSISRITFNDIKVHLVLLLVCLIFSVFYIVAKLVLSDVPPFVFLMLRLCIATPILWIAAFIVSRDTIFILPTKREFIFLAISGFFSVTVNQSLFLVGLDLSTASNAAITQPAIPIFSTLFAVMLGYERKTKLKFLGIGLAVVGAVLMVDFSHLTSDSADSSKYNTLLGNLCFLGNTIAYAIFLLSQKPLVDDGGMSASKCTAWSFTIGTPPVILICLVTSRSEINSQVASIGLASWFGILYVAIFATAFCFYASSWAVAKSDSTTVSIYLTVEPLATGILAYIFLDERLTPLNIVGGVVILIGVIGVMVSKHREKKKDLLNAYEKQKLKQYDMNNNPIELSKLDDDNSNNNSNNNTIRNSDSFSKIIISSTIISNPDEIIDDSNNNNNNNSVSVDIYSNNNLNNFNDNINSNNSKNNLLSVFKKQSILNDDSDDDDIHHQNGSDSILKNSNGGGSIIVF